MHSRRRRARKTAAAASVEAVLVLPVFALALLGVIFLHKLYVARCDARGLARRCALEYAMNGCHRVPEGCGDALSPLRLDAGAAEASRLRNGSGNADSFGILDVPLIGDAIDALFGSATRARVEREVPRPWRSEPARALGEFTVLCNERPRDVGSAVQRVFCDMIPVVQCP